MTVGQVLLIVALYHVGINLLEQLLKLLLKVLERDM